jgi:hypothetical protein
VNLDAFLQADFKSRMEGYASALQNGHMNIDEVRSLEDRNALPNGAGQPHHIQMNMGTVPGTGDPMPAEVRRQQVAPSTPPATPSQAPVKAAPTLTLPTNGHSRAPSDPKREAKTAIDKILTALRN